MARNKEIPQSDVPWKIETEFFRKNIILSAPDGVVNAISFDSFDRRLMSNQHPFAGRMSVGGVYLFYCYYDTSSFVEPVYIYAGRTGKFSRRSLEHWRGDTYKIEEFFLRYIDTGLLDKMITLGDGASVTARPHSIVRMAYWTEDNEESRMFLEHGIIFTYRPFMNKN